MKNHSLFIPFVSIIIPVYDDLLRLQKCLNALDNQNYPKNRFEIIIVNNYPKQDLSALAILYSNVRIETEVVKGSYAARNKGISMAKGEILAFTDSDCIPSLQWLTEGVRAIINQKYELIGGNVRFEFSSKFSGAEIYDSLTNMQIENNIKFRQVGKTANLFVKRQVIDNIGNFPEAAKSGGDVIWTQRATMRGFNIGYSSAAEIVHPARQLFPMLKKQYRVGKGQPLIWYQTTTKKKKFVFEVLKNFRAPPLISIYRRVRKSRLSISLIDFIRIVSAGWFCRVATGIGNIKAIYSIFVR